MLAERPPIVRELTDALRLLQRGEFSARLSRRDGPDGELADLFNEVATRMDERNREFERVSRVIGRDGRMTERVDESIGRGDWAAGAQAINSLIDDLARPTTEVARVIDAVARGDLTQKMALEIAGQPLKGEFLRIGTTVNRMVDQLSSFADEVTRVAREVGTEGKLGGQAQVRGVSGVWRELTDNVNSMAGNLTGQVRNIAQVTTAVARGDLTQKITVDARGEILEVKSTVNTMVDQLSAFADEVTRVAREVGTEGKLGGQAHVRGVSGTWKELTENVNQLAGNLTGQVRNIAQVTTAVAKGDLTQKITVDARGEILELKNTVNTMVDQLSSFADEVTRVAREVGTEGKLGGQARVRGVSGTWQELTDNVNSLAGNLTGQVRNIAQVTTAVAKGDLTQKITVDARGEILELKNTVNTMVDQLSSFADEVTRVAREVGTDGKLGGQAQVRGVSGTWQELTDNVNQLAGNLTSQVRNIAQVTTAVAKGDLTQKITVDAQGEILELKNTVNTMVDQLSSFADEVTRVAREVGSEGRLGGQATVRGVSGTWRELTDNVNSMAGNLTSQVRNIAQVTTAVAKGDLGQKITVDAQGEILELKNTVNTMVDQLSSFANEVTRVAREVGTEGKLGGQAEVRDVSGTWRDLTQSVNILAGNLTTQVRAIADVATAVTRGDLSQAISVETQGELAELKDNINQMINNLKDTTTKNAEQDWLKSNLARIGAQLQGQRDLRQVCQMIMSEITPVVEAQQGAFFLLEATREGLRLRLASSYGYAPKRGESVLSLGEGLVGQAAVERRSIRVPQTPAGYLTIGSGLGEAPPADLVIVPVLFEERVLGVIELASFKNFSDLHMSFLQQLVDTLGVVLNTIIANARTEELLAQSQRLTQELQAQSMELQRTNAELQEKAALLSEQNRNIEIKNREIEMARLGLEEKAEQLALSSQYKTEFMANMSHELRTPLNSLLVLARLLAENTESNLTGRQIEFARTIHDAGWDLLTLINDILDLSKVEAGKMDVHAGRVALDDVCGYVEQTFRAQSELKGLRFAVERGPGVPDNLFTDEQRLQQILKNLLSNAVKFTDAGTVTLSIHVGPEDMLFASPTLNAADRVVAFAVTDTGIGVAADKLKLIFDPFQQADGSTSRKYGGTGLGLSISREIARVLGGSITVQSDVGRGSTFTLYLPERYPGEAADPGSGLERLPDDTQIFAGSTYSGPLRSAPASLPAASSISVPSSIVDAEDIGAAIITQGSAPARPTPADTYSSPPQAYDTAEKPRPPAPMPRQVEPSRPMRGKPGPAVDTAVLAGRTVLIVDDDVRNVFALTSALELHGLTVLYADNGAAGIATLQAHPEVDLVLMDVMMPDMDGNETTAAIRKMPGFSELPILFLTAKAMPGDRDKSIAAGASDYITKPVDLDRLLRLMAGWVTRDAGAPGPAA